MKGFIMKKMKKVFMLTLIIAFAVSCSSVSVVHNRQRNKLEKKANRKEFFGAVAEIGEGQSIRQDVAREKARTDAYKKLAQSVKAKAEGISSDYIEEKGVQSQSTINETFRDLSNVITNTEIRGTKSVDEVILKHKDGYYIVYALYIITPKSINKRVIDQLEKGQPDFYDDFIQSKTFQNLLNEINSGE